MSSPNPTTLSLNPKPQNHDAAKEDLWEQALNTLSEEDRKQYVDSSDSPREVLQKVRYEDQTFLIFVILGCSYDML